jgi:hypothetical protein
MVIDSLGAHRTDLPGAGKVWITTRGVGTVYATYADGTRHNLDSANGSATFINVYGDASDGDSSWTGAAKTLTRDYFFDDLNIAALCTVKANGFRIYVKDTLTNNGFIIYNGNNGGNAGNASGATAGSAGAAAAAITGNYFPSPGAGIIGLAGATTGAGGGSNNAVTVSNIIGAASDVLDSTGGAGGAGASGAGGSGGGAGGTSGAGALAANSGGVRNWFNASIGRAFTTTGIIAFNVNGNSPSAGSGGAGGLGTTGTRGAGGGSGGSGSNGGIISLNCRYLVGSGRVEAKGGTGGNGGNGGNATGDYGSGGGGAGAPGGSGGLIVFTFNDSTGWTGTFTVAGGTGGTKGTGGTGGNASGSDGHAGATGLTGLIFRFQI